MSPRAGPGRSWRRYRQNSGRTAKIAYFGTLRRKHARSRLAIFGRVVDNCGIYHVAAGRTARGPTRRPRFPDLPPGRPPGGPTSVSVTRPRGAHKSKTGPATPQNGVTFRFLCSYATKITPHVINTNARFRHLCPPRAKTAGPKSRVRKPRKWRCGFGPGGWVLASRHQKRVGRPRRGLSNAS